MSWLLGFFGAFLTYEGLTGNSKDISQNMRPWAVVVGLVLIVLAVIVYLTVDRQREDD